MEDPDVETGGESQQSPLGSSFANSIVAGSKMRAEDVPENGPDLNLFEVSQFFLQSAAIIYTFFDLREMARTGKLKNPGGILEDRPVGYLEILNTVTSNRQTVEDHLGQKEWNFFEQLIDEAEKEAEDNAFKLGLPRGYKSLENTPEKFGVVVFADENVENDSGGLLYMIEVDALHQFIIVTFRGTANLNDVQTDARVGMAEISNPLDGTDETQPRTANVHAGFAEYLYGCDDKSQMAKDRVGTRCHDIIDQVHKIMQENPGFSLYITGHSMGAALASLFAFELACHEGTKSVVTCIGIASPRVSDKNFRSAFNYLERRGKLRCLNVSNLFDPIPLMPNSWLFCLCTGFKTYRHVGLQLILAPRSFGFTVRYRKNHVRVVDWIKSFFKGFFRFFVIIFLMDVLCCLGRHNHGNGEYSNRLSNNREKLSAISLDGLYKQIEEGKDDE